MLELTGKRFRKLLVLKQLPTRNHKSVWLCQCDCGNLKEVYGSSLTYGTTVSCGCWKRSGEKNVVHGMSKSSEYHIWAGMMSRCYSKTDNNYKNYGGRGITVCDRWHTAKHFFADMGRRPTPHHSLDRIDNNGNYGPENCRWASRTEQNRNTRRAHMLTHNGKTQRISEWAEEKGLPYGILLHRIKKGWDIEKALSEPIQPICRLIAFNGKVQTISEWASELGMTFSALCHRLKRGWTIEKALLTPVRKRT